MKKAAITVLMGMVLINTAFGQTVLQDKGGTGTFTLGGQVISFNAADASVTGSIGRIRAQNEQKRFWNATIKFKSTDGVSTLLDGTKLKPTVDIGGYYGKSFQGTTWDWFAGAKFSTAFFNLLKDDKSNTFNDRVFVGPTATFGVNRLGDVRFLNQPDKKSSYVFGITANISYINNLSDLNSVEIYQSTQVVTNDATKTLLQDKKAGFSGDYHASVTGMVNADFFVFPNILGGQVAVGGYARTRIFGYQPRQNLGAGFLLGGKGAPANIVFGLLYQFNDIFDQLNKENQFLKRGGVNLVAGYKF